MNYRVMPEPEWEGPVFKVLTKNDSGARTGHQAGFVVPKDIAGIFPSGEARFDAILRVDGHVVGLARPRFQIQTWGGTRGGERRITDLGAWDKFSTAGDIVLIERSTISDLYYRLSLVRKTSAYFASLQSYVAKRWGSLAGVGPIVPYDTIENERHRLESLAQAEFNPFGEERQLNIEARIARSRAFATAVLRNYAACAICQGGLRLEDNMTELEAAHIVPVGAGGSDDPRNGLGLCRAHHWAFDRGFIGVSNDRRVIVSNLCGEVGLAALRPLHDRTLLEPANRALAPDARALEWHRLNVFDRYRRAE